MIAFLRSTLPVVMGSVGVCGSEVRGLARRPYNVETIHLARGDRDRDDVAVYALFGFPGNRCRRVRWCSGRCGRWSRRCGGRCGRWSRRCGGGAAGGAGGAAACGRWSSRCGRWSSWCGGRAAGARAVRPVEQPARPVPPAAAQQVVDQAVVQRRSGAAAGSASGGEGEGTAAGELGKGRRGAEDAVNNVNAAIANSPQQPSLQHAINFHRSANGHRTVVRRNRRIVRQPPSVDSPPPSFDAAATAPPGPAGVTVSRGGSSGTTTAAMPVSPPTITTGRAAVAPAPLRQSRRRLDRQRL